MENNKQILILTSILVILITTTWFVGNQKINSQIATINSTPIIKKTLTEKNNFQLPAKSVLAVSSDLRNTYYAKNIKDRRPIASLTKLMTAIVILENYDLTKSVKIPPEVINLPESKNILRANETLKVFDLLAALLIESNNEAAYALAGNWPSEIGTFEFKTQKFIEAMNKKASDFKMINTHFSEPSGLDDANNFSTAWDLALLAQQAFNNYPLISQLTTKEQFVTYSQEGIYHKFENSNKLLNVLPEIKLGKTGFTNGAGPSILLIVKEQKQPLIIILLNAQDRFANAQELLERLNY